MKNHIVGFGTNSVAALKAGKGEIIHYVLPDELYQDKRTLAQLRRDHIALNRFNGMLARGEVKEVVGEFPNITAPEIRGHLIGIYSSQSAP